MPTIHSSLLSIAAIAGIGCALAASPALAKAQPADLATQHQLWELVGKLVRSADQGSVSLTDAWPTARMTMPAKATGALQVIDGGTFEVAPALRVQNSEIRVLDSGNFRLVQMELAGACISPTDVSQHFPEVEVVHAPSPNNPDPRSYHRVKLGSMLVSFGFPQRGPECLAGIVIKPNPAAPPRHHRMRISPPATGTP